MDIQNGVNETFRKRSRLGWLPGDQEKKEIGSPCQGCDQADTCEKICDKLRAAVQSAKGCSEVLVEGKIIIQPEKGLIPNFSSLQFNYQQGDDPEDPTDTEHGIEWNTGGLNFSMTAVFIEYFFKRRPLADIAEDLGVKEGTVHSQFTKALEKIEKIICILDARESVLKFTGKNSTFNRFDDDQKAWLLSAVFGFKLDEIAGILGHSRDRLKRSIAKQNKQYTALMS